jgi:D-alanyl-D-alanine carboxypeptidase
MNVNGLKQTLLGLLLVLALGACGAGDPPATFTQGDLQATLEMEWQAFTSGKSNFGGGIAMQILSPRGDHFISAGMGATMDNAHHFRTASVTKTFTAAAIMLLQQRGQLNIDDKITASIPGTLTPYFPYAIPHADGMTIRMILMHRAGVFDLTNTDIQDNAASSGKPYVGRNYIEYTLDLDANHQFTFDELFRVIERDEQIGFQPPASQYRYSDSGYSILAYIIERVSGKTYEAFIRDEFLLPNNLLSSSLPWRGTDQTLPAPFVNGYDWAGGTLRDVTVQNMSPFVGNGNLITTPLDLATWAKRLFTGNAGLTPATVEAMKAGLPSGGNSTYGLGIKYFADRGYGHDGDHEGYITFMFYRPEQDIAYVVLVNVWDLGNFPHSIVAQHDFMTHTANRILARMGY